MEIAKHIFQEAKSMLIRNVALPAEIEGAPGFFLAAHDDSSIFALSSMEEKGTYYKIGVKKTAKAE